MLISYLPSNTNTFKEQGWDSFKKLYLIMDEAQLIFAINPMKVISYFHCKGAVNCM